MMFMRASDLLLLSDAFRAVRPRSEKTLSNKAVTNASCLDRIRAGGDCTTGTYGDFVQWFADNWPEGAVWPSGVARPPDASGWPDGPHLAPHRDDVAGHRLR